MLRVRNLLGVGAILGAAWLLGPAVRSHGQDTAPVQPAETKPAETKPAETKPADKPAVVTDTSGRIRLSPEHDVWLDPKRKQLILEGEVCLQRGPLEMLVTLAGTKTHEAVVACKVKAFVVHAGLLALGAKPGGGAKFAPKFVPASGTEIEVRFRWTDAAGKAHDVDAREWVRHTRTMRTMEPPFVFAGSGFLVNETTGERRYQAEEGDFVCVSNFPTAMLDVPTRSSQDSADLQFEAFFERIPPVRTPITVVLIPKLEPAK